MPIHRSQAPQDDGYFVSASWLYGLTTLVFALLCGILTLSWLIYNNSVRVDSLMEYNDISDERRRAFGDMIENRARVQKWTYEHICNEAKQKGQPCLDNPTWYADPKLYPKLQGPLGTGLLPPEVTNGK